MTAAVPSRPRQVPGSRGSGAHGREAHAPKGPPPGIPGLDPRWSRLEIAPDAGGVLRTWHVLDTGPSLAERGEPVVATLLCVHGNPTWSYLWRRLLEQAPPGWRVVAVDQLGMGWSARTEAARSLPQRIEDLDRLSAVLELDGPVVTLAHDWGGPVSLGWALRHRDRLAGVVLTNTAVHQPADSAPPALIRLARSPGVLDAVCRRTPLFVRAATALSVPPLPREVRDAFAAPYGSTDRRTAVADFVRDIPFEEQHPSRAALDAVAEGVRSLDVPALLVWGARDPVFGERHLQDLLARLPRADVQRYADASHLVLEDRPEGVGVIWRWLRAHVPADRAVAGHKQEPDDRGTARPPGSALRPLPVRVDVTAPHRPAVVELRNDGRTVTFGELAASVEDVARGLALRGVGRGDRVALLVPPGVELTTLVYALWRLGAVVVVADAGLGLGRLGAALRSAAPRLVVGVGRGLVLAAAARVPAQRLRVEVGGTELEALAVLGRGLRGDAGATADPLPAPDEVAGGADGAVLFTSGATGPPKGVVYTRAQLGAQLALLRDSFVLVPGERLVAAFAPFALYGPALGLTSAVPDMDVTAPHTLTAAALADAVAAVDASVVFAAPAALRNVVTTGDGLDPARREALSRPRLVLSAGAPVPVDVLHAVRRLLTSASTATPYGMTEALPVTTVDPTALTAEEANGGSGVCVGAPVAGVEVRVAPLDGHGIPAEELSATPGTVGEIVVRGGHVKDRYDRLWDRQSLSERPPGWHRTGDVGHFDEQGRLWVEGRLAHVVTGPDGPVTPYAVEARVRAVPGVHDGAVVGVGPAGTQQVVVAVVPHGRGGLRARVVGAPAGRSVLAPPQVAAAVRRAASPVPVAAVLVRDWLPVDVRHASKVDRGALADWADAVLHGRSARERLRRRLRGGAPRTRSR